MRKLKLALATALVVAGLARPALAGTPVVCASTGTIVNSMTFNSAILIQLINNPGSFQAGRALGILTAQIRNAQTCEVVNPTYNLTVTEIGNPNAGCSGVVFQATGLQATKTILPGQNVTLLANDFGPQTVPTPCPTFVSQIQNQFQNISAEGDGLGQQVQALLNRHFVVCLQDAVTHSEACVNLTIFNPPAAVIANAANLILPANQATVTDLPTFVWAPANYRGDPSGIDYKLVISQSSSGDPWYVANNIPTAQTYYHWSGSPVLAPGRYYWHVVSLLHKTGQTVGGQNGNGWSVVNSFTVGSPLNASGPCSYTLADLDAFVRANAGDKAALLQGFNLNGILPSALNDPDLCALLASPQTKLVGITVTKR